MVMILKGLAKMDGQGDLYDYSFDDVCKKNNDNDEHNERVGQDGCIGWPL